MSTRPLHVVLVVPGGIGTGHHNMGVPVLEQYAQRLAEHARVTVLSLAKINQGYQPRDFELRDISGSHPVITAWRMLRTVQQLHRQHPIDIIHGFWVRPAGLLAVIVQWLHNIPAFITLQGGDAVYLPQIKYGQLNNMINRWLAQQAVRRAAQVVLLSRRQTETLATWGIFPRHAALVHWGVGHHFRFRQRQFTAPVRMLVVGNLTAVKDQSTALRAFALMRKEIACTLTIIGEGELATDLRRLVHELGIEEYVTFEDPHLPTEMAVCYDRHDVLLHPSLSEGQSLVVTEALHCGLLVAGTGVGPLVELPTVCVVVPFGDAAALARETLAAIRRGYTPTGDTWERWQQQTRLPHTVHTMVALYRSACRTAGAY